MITINRFIKILISADVLFNFTSSFIAPVFAIFIVQSIEGGTAKTAGTAMAVLWITKSIVRLPISYYVDKKKGEIDDYYSMMNGLLLFSLAHFLYLLAELPSHLYMIQVIMGIGQALAFSPLYGMFTRHIDKHHESFEWGVDISLVGVAISIAGYAGGVIADNYGFDPVFIISGIFSLFGAFLLLLLKSNIIKQEAKR